MKDSLIFSLSLNQESASTLSGAQLVAFRCNSLGRNLEMMTNLGTAQRLYAFEFKSLSTVSIQSLQYDDYSLQNSCSTLYVILLRSKQLNASAITWRQNMAQIRERSDETIKATQACLQPWLLIFILWGANRIARKNECNKSVKSRKALRLRERSFLHHFFPTLIVDQIAI